MLTSNRTQTNEHSNSNQTICSTRQIPHPKDPHLPPDGKCPPLAYPQGSICHPVANDPFSCPPRVLAGHMPRGGTLQILLFSFAILLQIVFCCSTDGLCLHRRRKWSLPHYRVVNACLCFAQLPFATPWQMRCPVHEMIVCHSGANGDRQVEGR